MAKRRPSGDGMVRKREDGRWEGRIVVGHKENGEPIFRYVLAKTQKELLAKLHRDMDIYQDAQLTEDSRMTLGEWLDRWMEDYGAATLRPNPQVVERFCDPHRALSIARIECHYFMNNAFLEPNQLLRDMHKIAHLPAVIVHGRYDMICPLDNAWELHQAWPGSELQIIREAGHVATEPGITDALVRASEQMARRLLNLQPDEA